MAGRALLAASPAAAQTVTWQMANEYHRMRANHVSIPTEVPQEFLEALGKAGRVTVDEWRTKTGASGQAILDDYGKQLAGRR